MFYFRAGIGPRVLDMLDKHCTAELFPQFCDNPGLRLVISEDSEPANPENGYIYGYVNIHVYIKYTYMHLHMPYCF